VAIARPRILYLDASAIVKLVVRESESAALRAHLAGAELVTSEISLTEVPRAAHVKTGRTEAVALAEAILRRFDLVVLDDDLHRAAARAAPRELRTLDALHLVAAERLRGRLSAVIAYDRRLTEACQRAGLTVESPRP
jgi:predicted nucleic acid-binding protein